MRFVTNMSVIGITILCSIAVLIAVSQGQCIRVRSGSSGQQPGSQTSTPCSTSIEDLTTLLAIVRALEEKESSKPAISNAEEIIMQLVNALVYATTHNVGCPKGGSNSGVTNSGGGTGTSIGTVSGGGTNTGGGANTGGGTNTGGGYPGMVPPPTMEQPDNGLITLDLLQQQANQDIEHLLRLDIVGKNILDVGLGPDKGLVGGLLNTLL